MDELKLLVQMVASLPAMAMWVIAFFFVYKVVFIGSVYGLIRFGIEKLHSWLTGASAKEVRPMLDGLVISGNISELMGQLARLKNKAINTNSPHIHGCDVAWLREAIDAKEVADREKNKAGCDK
jgi:hypothetical protein